MEVIPMRMQQSFERMVGLGLGIFLVTLLHASAARAADVAGVGTVTETYTCCGDFPASWDLTFLRNFGSLIKVDNLDATRTGFGLEEQGKAITIQGIFSAKHDCYGDTCGDCAYKFKGHVSGSTMSGSVVYKCSDGHEADGTFTATTGGAAGVASHPESTGRADPR